MARTDEYYDLMEEKRRKAREEDQASAEGKTATLKKYEGKSPPSADMRPRELMSEAVRTKDAMNRDKLNAGKAAKK